MTEPLLSLQWDSLVSSLVMQYGCSSMLFTTCRYRHYTEKITLYQDDTVVASATAPQIFELPVTSLVLGSSGTSSSAFDGDLALATIINEKNLQLWQQTTAVPGFDVLQQGTLPPNSTLTPSGLWL